MTPVVVMRQYRVPTYFLNSTKIERSSLPSEPKSELALSCTLWFYWIDFSWDFSNSTLIVSTKINLLNTEETLHMPISPTNSQLEDQNCREPSRFSLKICMWAVGSKSFKIWVFWVNRGTHSRQNRTLVQRSQSMIQPTEKLAEGVWLSSERRFFKHWPLTRTSNQNSQIDWLIDWIFFVFLGNAIHENFVPSCG